MREKPVSFHPPFLRRQRGPGAQSAPTEKRVTECKALKLMTLPFRGANDVDDSHSFLALRSGKNAALIQEKTYPKIPPSSPHKIPRPAQT
ncbi:MAG: hypothetical protein LUE61_03210, partial [Clostridiales bacterium]|nr:hypothetical protein [Clostridiales bacterium]